MYVLRELTTAPTTSWSNGAGVTTELVSFAASRVLSPEGTEPWRLSVAHLAEPAPFSSLPGVQRTFMPLDGALTLVVDGVAHELQSGMPLQFSGDADVSLVRLPAPCRALNLMVRGRRPGRIVAAGGGGDSIDGALAAVAVARPGTGRAGGTPRSERVRSGEDVLVATPGVTSLTPQPITEIEEGAARFLLFAS